MSGDLLGSLLVGGHASSAIIVGHHAGLWVSFAGAPGKVWTIAEFADANDCKERWVREWVGVLASAGVLSLTASGELTCPDAIAQRLHPDKSEVCFFNSLEFCCDKETEIAACFKKDGPLGLGYDKFPNFHGWMQGWTSTMIKADNYPDNFVSLVGEGLHDALTRGITVLEPGCGSGHRVTALAKVYPNSSFTAFDIDAELVAKNSKMYEASKNVEFVVADFTAMPEEWSGRFDYLLIFDCMHDLSYPALAMAGIQRVLKSDALFSMMDINTCSDMAEQAKSPVSAVLYNISLHHCMSVSLSAGGVGLGTCWGVELAQKMLKEAGFDQICITKEGMNAFYVVKKGNGIQ